MDKGFALDVEPYCADCPEFKVSVDDYCYHCEDMATLTPITRYLRNISCEHIERCRSIYREAREQLKKEDEHERTT